MLPGLARMLPAIQGGRGPAGKALAWSSGGREGEAGNRQSAEQETIRWTRSCPRAQGTESSYRDGGSTEGSLFPSYNFLGPAWPSGHLLDVY